ncbi:MAG: hypothetical protein QOD99_724 [Chthoniobacter sp.]|jgi:hypothetical protein|nr:hypothetical protein [Chthoniobacter sp.]
MNADDSGLTFQWPESRHVSFALPGFFLLSLGVHALSFYIFQIAYPVSARTLPPPAHVSLLAPGSPENDRLLRWIEAEDPAVSARPPEASPEHLFDLPYEPSFAKVRTEPKLIAEQTPQFAYPSALSPLAFISNTTPEPDQRDASAPPPRTRLLFDGELAARGANTDASFEIRSATTELQPARFLVGVSDRGEVRYLFLEESSGDKKVDEQAENHLRAATLKNASEPLTWGRATFFWGAEVFPPSESRKTSSP